MLCPPHDSFRQYLSGQLDSATATAFEAHVDECPACRQALARHADETVGTAPSDPSGPETPADEPPGRLLSALRRRPPATAEESLLPEGLLAPPHGPGELGRLAHYRVLELLGSGGMGLVFLAEDTRLRRRVALKVMRPDRTDAALRRRFLREAHACAAVESDHIVTVYDVAEDRGVIYLAMQHLKGEPLNARLKRQRRPPLAEAARVAREVALGLAAAHDAGLIHRDVKPSNIWVEAPSGRAKLLDFGLARPVEAGQTTEALTTAGNVLGTPGYLAPEQADGRRVDARADIFSLGCVLYEMAAGRPPYRAKGVLALLNELATKKPPTLRELDPTLPEDLSGLVEKMMAADPADRPRSAAAVADELAAIERERAGPGPRGGAAGDEDSTLFGGLTEEVEVVTRPRPGRRPEERRGPNYTPWVAAAVVALLAAGSAIVYFATRKGPPATEASKPEPPPKEKKDGTPPVAKSPELPRDERDREMMAKLAPAQQEARLRDGLARVNRPGFNPNRPGSLATDTLGGPAIKSVEVAGDALADLRPLRALPALTHVDLKAAGGGKVALKGLEGLPLAYLSAKDAAVDLADLGPMPTLKHLNLEGSTVAHPERVPSGIAHLDLSKSDVPALDFVKTLPALRKLELRGTAVADLTPLAGTKLELLDITDCAQVKDVGPLANVPLTELRCSFQPAFAKVLREHKTLRTINGTPVEDFFK
jgi:tRNA A-37 threonylcarbamoyl transferase component Bud32